MKWPARRPLYVCMRLGRGSREQRHAVPLALVFSLQPLRASYCSEAGPLEPVLPGVFPGPCGSTSLQSCFVRRTRGKQPRLTLSVRPQSWRRAQSSSVVTCLGQAPREGRAVSRAGHAPALEGARGFAHGLQLPSHREGWFEV